MEARPENLGDDFWTKYRGLAAKLKKRFLKKPNVAEVADEFRSLAKRLAGDEHRPLAGVCSLAVARCEQTIGNLPCEAEALLNAARLFLAQAWL
ncbi:unnamed protein product [Notodromas monacha]|uniref:Uncharacterized protein n=1 Tax=Notodromas monacha TaxID=399045 RepID=A0A7R9BFK8_9CRUS|nr:unnamed protein product [Notodromas monacha]CAG0914371.1 unnamed protein product [Notodromas monacha]